MAKKATTKKPTILIVDDSNAEIKSALVHLMGNWTIEPQSPDDFREVLAEYKDKPCRFLEIGSYDGTSAIGFITMISEHPESMVVCIDPFEGSRESFIYEKNPETVFLENTKAYGERIQLIKDLSENALRALEPESFDVAYVDGHHDSKNVLEDAILAFKLLKVGGFLIFDDWGWNLDGVPQHQPQIAIKAFTECYKENIIIHKWNYRVFIKKIK